MILAVQHASDPTGSQLSQLLQWPRLYNLEDVDAKVKGLLPPALQIDPLQEVHSYRDQAQRRIDFIVGSESILYHVFSIVNAIRSLLDFRVRMSGSIIALESSSFSLLESDSGCPPRKALRL